METCQLRRGIRRYERICPQGSHPVRPVATVETVPSAIRPATEADGDAVLAVHAASRRAYYQAGGVSVEDDTDGEAYRQFWSQVLADGRNRAWVAHEAGRCVGFLVAGPPWHEDVKDRQALELIGLYLLPEAWGKGLAHSLHDRFVQFLLDTPSALEGVLEVWSGNDRALAFYARHGWEPDGRSRPGPGERPFTGLRLVRSPI